MIAPRLARMDIEFAGEMWFWKGPAPWHFVTVPLRQAEGLAVGDVVTVHLAVDI
jgi:hypothetical protein